MSARQPTSGLRKRAESVIQAGSAQIQSMAPEEIQRLVYELDVHQVELELQNEELRQTQLELQDARDRYADLFDFAPVGYMTLDHSGVIRETNLTAAALLGAERAEIVGKRLSDFISPLDQDAYYRHRRQTLVSTLANRCEVRLERRTEGGAERYVALESFGLRDPEVAKLGCRTALLDITDRKRAEAERERLGEDLLQSQKMEAIGQLAGGIAHDFNNIMMAVLGYLELASGSLKGRLSAEDEVWDFLREMERGGRRVAELTGHLLAFGRRHAADARIIEPAASLTGLEKLLRRLIREDIALEIACEPGLWRIKADPVQFEQVVVNLVLNGRDALPRGGNIRVVASNVELDEQHAQRHANSHAGPHVLLTVSDNGGGMDKAVLQRIYEPFFTTKRIAQNSGMGLTVVYGVVRQASGHIVVESEPGRGSTFRIYWPAIREPAGETAVAAVPEGSFAGDEAVLLCEDDDAIRSILERVLRENGYTVLAAANGAEALRAAEGFAGRIQVLVTDVIMPGMNGRELAEELLRTHRDLKVLLISGYAADTVLVGGELGSGMEFVQKPISPKDLMRRIRKLFG